MAKALAATAVTKQEKLADVYWGKFVYRELYRIFVEEFSFIPLLPEILQSKQKTFFWALE